MDLEQLIKLHALKEQGVLTESEYELQKQKLLNSNQSNSFSNPSTNEVSIKDPSKNLVWLIAFAPLIGGFLEALFMENSSFFSSSNVWIVTIILNGVLCYIDEEKLKKNNINTEELNVWLIPLYLWERAKILKHNPVYFYVWIVCFVLSLTGVA